jgi:hypothetical protein
MQELFLYLFTNFFVTFDKSVFCGDSCQNNAIIKVNGKHRNRVLTDFAGAAQKGMCRNFSVNLHTDMRHIPLFNTI